MEHEKKKEDRTKMKYDNTIAYAAGGAMGAAAGAIIKQRVDYTDLALIAGCASYGYYKDRKERKMKEL